MKRLLYLFLLLTITTSCKDNLMGGGPFLEVYIEDSPAEFLSALVSVEKIEVQHNDTWIPLDFKASVISIMSYTGGISLLLSSQEIEPGNYSKIRFTFGKEGNKVQISGQTEYTLLTLVEESQVVELPININATEGKYYVMCDMDVAKSINAEEATLTPHLTIIDLATAGAISGSIVQKGAAVEILQVEARKISGDSKFTYTNFETGAFFLRLEEGEYSIYITPKKESIFIADTIHNVVVRSAMPTNMGRITLREKVIPVDPEEPENE